MVVVAADAVEGVLADPLDARARLGAVIDQVADTDARVERLPDGFQGRAVPVDVRDDEYAPAIGLPESRPMLATKPCPGNLSLKNISPSITVTPSGCCGCPWKLRRPLPRLRGCLGM